MAQVTTPKPATTIHDGPARILSVTEAKHYMLKYTDDDGREMAAMVVIFGEADYGKGAGRPEDRYTGVWVLANMVQLQEQLRLVPKQQAKRIVAALEEKGLFFNGHPVSGTTQPPTLPDVSDVFSGLEEKPADEKTE